MKVRNMRYEDLSRLILSVCEDYVALEIIAEAVHREASYLINRVIPRMLEAITREIISVFLSILYKNIV